jgi:hypothetical protein
LLLNVYFPMLTIQLTMDEYNLFLIKENSFLIIANNFTNDFLRNNQRIPTENWKRIFLKKNNINIVRSYRKVYIMKEQKLGVENS